MAMRKGAAYLLMAVFATTVTCSLACLSPGSSTMSDVCPEHEQAAPDSSCVDTSFTASKSDHLIPQALLPAVDLGPVQDSAEAILSFVATGELAEPPFLKHRVLRI